MFFKTTSQKSRRYRKDTKFSEQKWNRRQIFWFKSTTGFKWILLRHVWWYCSRSLHVQRREREGKLLYDGHVYHKIDFQIFFQRTCATCLDPGGCKKLDEASSEDCEEICSDSQTFMFFFGFLIGFAVVLQMKPIFKYIIATNIVCYISIGTWLILKQFTRGFCFYTLTCVYGVVRLIFCDCVRFESQEVEENEHKHGDDCYYVQYYA